MHRVLVVDDYAEARAPLVKLLSRSGFDATAAADGAAALAAMSLARPDLVLLDVMMPHMDGFDVLRQIRADRRHDAVVVLMYTACSDPDGRARATALGAQGYIVKGTPFENLLADIRRQLGPNIAA